MIKTSLQREGPMANATATIQSKSYTPANKRQTVLYIREKRKKNEKKGETKKQKDLNGLRLVMTLQKT